MLKCNVLVNSFWRIWRLWKEPDVYQFECCYVSLISHRVQHSCDTLLDVLHLSSLATGVFIHHVAYKDEGLKAYPDGRSEVYLLMFACSLVSLSQLCDLAIHHDHLSACLMKSHICLLKLHNQLVWAVILHLYFVKRLNVIWLSKSAKLWWVCWFTPIYTWTLHQLVTLTAQYQNVECDIHGKCVNNNLRSECFVLVRCEKSHRVKFVLFVSFVSKWLGYPSWHSYNISHNHFWVSLLNLHNMFIIVTRFLSF